MKREEHLIYCRVCRNRKFDPKQGVICSLTNQIADFDPTCPSYDEDTELKAKADEEKTENELIVKLASKEKRIANYWIDFVGYLVVTFIFAVMFFITWLIISPDSYDKYVLDNSLLEYTIVFICAIIYYGLLETLTGKTLAKFFTKTRVVNKYGRKPDFGTILLRTIIRMIPFEALSFLGSKKPGWHDRFSGTYVINDK